MIDARRRIDAITPLDILFIGGHHHRSQGLASQSRAAIPTMGDESIILLRKEFNEIKEELIEADVYTLQQILAHPRLRGVSLHVRGPGQARILKGWGRIAEDGSGEMIMTKFAGHGPTISSSSVSDVLQYCEAKSGFIDMVEIGSLDAMLVYVKVSGDSEIGAALELIRACFWLVFGFQTCPVPLSLDSSVPGEHDSGGSENSTIQTSHAGEWHAEWDVCDR